MTDQRERKSVWGQGPRRLVDLLDEHRAEDFDRFHEMINFAQRLPDSPGVNPGVKSRMRCLELVCVAAVEAAQREVEVHGVSAHEAAWAVIGSLGTAAGLIAIQVYADDGKRGVVRRHVTRELAISMEGFLDLCREQDGEARS